MELQNETTSDSSTLNTIPSSLNAIPLQHDSEPLVMQIVVRRDLFEKENWGLGPLMAQAAHAATAILHETRERQETIDYLADLRNMHKVVLQTPDVWTLRKLSATLSSADPFPIPHYTWIEQPEDIPTCIALAPNRRDKCIRKADIGRTQYDITAKMAVVSTHENPADPKIVSSLKIYS